MFLWFWAMKRSKNKPRYIPREEIAGSARDLLNNYSSVFPKERVSGKENAEEYKCQTNWKTQVGLAFQNAEMRGYVGEDTTELHKGWHKYTSERSCDMTGHREVKILDDLLGGIISDCEAEPERKSLKGFFSRN